MAYFVRYQKLGWLVNRCWLVEDQWGHKIANFNAFMLRGLATLLYHSVPLHTARRNLRYSCGDTSFTAERKLLLLENRARAKCEDVMLGSEV